MRWIVRLGAMALLCVLAQRLSVQQSELAAAGTDLDRQRADLARREGDLDDLEGDLDRLDTRLAELDERISASERAHGGTIPRDEYEDYLGLVEERNEVASERNTIIAYQGRVQRDYEDDVARHNDAAAGASAQARESTALGVLGTIWADLTDGWGGS